MGKKVILLSNRPPLEYNEEDIFRCMNSVIKGEVPVYNPLSNKGGLVEAGLGFITSDPLVPWKTTWYGLSMNKFDQFITNGKFNHVFEKILEMDPDHKLCTYLHGNNGKVYVESDNISFNQVSIHINDQTLFKHYDENSNAFEWPVKHFATRPLFDHDKYGDFFPVPRFSPSAFRETGKVNKIFADSVIAEAVNNEDFWESDDDLFVWTHDYHLMLFPKLFEHGMVKKINSGQISKDNAERIRTIFFEHTPHENIDIYNQYVDLIKSTKGYHAEKQLKLALRDKITSVLHNNYVSGHTKRYLENRLGVIEAVLGNKALIKQDGDLYRVTYDGNETLMGVDPIGLLTKKVTDSVKPENVLKFKVNDRDIGKLIKDDKDLGRITFGAIERADYTKGLIHRTHIFKNTADTLLSRYGIESRLYQITQPSRLQSMGYAKTFNDLREAKDWANAQFKSKHGVGYDLIVHGEEGIPKPKNYELMRDVDVMLITPLEDGFNLVAAEYILSQRYKKANERGLLVLGNCGAADRLKEMGYVGEKALENGIVYIDPFDPNSYEQIAFAVKHRDKFNISQELITRVEKEWDVKKWEENIIEKSKQTPNRFIKY